jgi:hypothetical protein
MWLNRKQNRAGSVEQRARRKGKDVISYSLLVGNLKAKQWIAGLEGRR